MITDSGEAKESSSEVASAIGLIGGMIIYFFIFMYASQVMKGVIEENKPDYRGIGLFCQTVSISVR